LHWKDLGSFRFRHLGLIVALLLAHVLRLPGGHDDRILWIVGLLALANLVLDQMSRRNRAGGWPTLVAALISLCGWSLLIRFTGGIASPFLAGLMAEVVLTGFEISPTRTMLVTGASILGFWVASSIIQTPHEIRSQLIMSGVLAAVGAVTAIQARRGRIARMLLEQSLCDVRRRLESLDESADRLPSPAEDRRIRIAHGLKNSVHSLRGLVALLDSEVTDSGRGRRILGALVSLADQIEDFARLAIREPKASLRIAEDSVDAARALEPILSEARLIWPHLQFEGVHAAAPLPIALSPGEFHEVLLNLLSNAAESAGQGMVRVSIRRSSLGIDIIVEDDGPGPPANMLHQTGKTGFSTRGEGRGYGLVIVQQLVERVGGRLDVGSGIRGGGCIQMALPAGGDGSACRQLQS